MPTPTIYRPNPVFVPEHVNIRRDVLRYVDGEIKNIPFTEAGDIDLSWHDSTTLFYDTFIADEKNHLFCIAPPFHNFGTPKAILLMEQSLKFKIFTYTRSTIIRVCINQHIKHQLQAGGKLTFIFDQFSVSTIYQHISPAIKRNNITLVTHQKNNPIQWIKDWCLYYHRLHDINDIVIYDNGSQNLMKLKTELAYLQDEINIILVTWNFPYGLNLNTTDDIAKQANTYTQKNALNHHRLLFGTKFDWVVNADIDEYVFTCDERSMTHHLSKWVPLYLIDAYLMPCPSKITKNRKQSRFFHHAMRPAQFESTAGKYIYQPKYVTYNSVHNVKLMKDLPGLIGRLCRGIYKRVPRNKHKLFYYHLRGLNTNWNYTQLQLSKDRCAQEDLLTFDSRLIRMAHKLGFRQRRKWKCYYAGSSSNEGIVKTTTSTTCQPPRHHHDQFS